MRQIGMQQIGMQQKPTSKPMSFANEIYQWALPMSNPMRASELFQLSSCVLKRFCCSSLSSFGVYSNAEFTILNLNLELNLKLNLERSSILDGY